MDSIAQVKRYLPHEISTKVGAVKLYRETKDIGFVCRRYHISKASLMRWNDTTGQKNLYVRNLIGLGHSIPMRIQKKN